METFLLQNAARHQQLIKQFKPKTAKDEDTASSSSIEVATRIRPILADEAAWGQVPAAFPRPGESGVVDLHELRRVVRGPPPLNVSALTTFLGEQSCWIIRVLECVYQLLKLTVLSLSLSGWARSSAPIVLPGRSITISCSRFSLGHGTAVSARCLPMDRRGLVRPLPSVGWRDLLLVPCSMGLCAVIGSCTFPSLSWLEILRMVGIE